MEGLFYLFALSIIISGIMVISTFNPVHSVFWLIVAFVSASAIFIVIEVEFIGLLFLIVYVGAIAILFLFVIMMLNLTDLKWGEDMSNYLPAGFLVGVIFFIEILIFQSNNFSYRLDQQQLFLINGWDYIEKSSNIEVLGRNLYTNYYYLFIIAGLILLTAMIGSILMVGGVKIQRKVQDSFKQTSRESFINFWV